MTQIQITIDRPAAKANARGRSHGRVPLGHGAKGPGVEETGVHARGQDEPHLQDENAIGDEVLRMRSEHEEARQHRDHERADGPRQRVAREPRRGDFARQPEKPQVDDEDRAEHEAERHDVERLDRRVRPERFAHVTRDARSLQRLQRRGHRSSTVLPAIVMRSARISSGWSLDG
jgi:hypothetical protein